MSDTPIGNEPDPYQDLVERAKAARSEADAANRRARGLPAEVHESPFTHQTVEFETREQAEKYIRENAWQAGLSREGESQPTPNYKAAQDFIEQDDLRKGSARAQKAREEAAEAARIAAGKADVRQTGQEVLIANMRKIRLATSITSAAITRGFGNVSGDLYKKLLEERNKYIIPAAQMPPQGVLELLQPTNMSAFLHATPAQLSSLMPLLRFFIVSKNKDKKTGRPLQKEVYFSDFASEKKIKDLAAARRGHTIYDPDDDKTNKLFSKGSEVGIKSFTWDYHNKHEGDKIIKAKLELYFGTLTELINKEYLNFIFTNGKHNSADPSTTGTDRGGISARMKYLEKKIKETEDSGVLLPGKSPQKAKNDKVTDDFKQLKVVVGWSIPKGNQKDLERLFGGPKKFKSFKEGVQATQKVILLNLTNYDVNFSQEGPVTLSLDYVGSSDNYLSSVEADILGENNFSQGNLNSQQVLIFADGLDKDLGQRKIDPNGYLYHQMTNDEYGKVLLSESGKIPVRLDRLKRESDYIARKREFAVLQESYGSNVSEKGQQEGLEKLDSYAESVEKAYSRAKKELRVKRYASLINNLIGGTGRGSRVYVAHATKGADDQVTVKVGGSGARAKKDAKDRLKKLAEMTPEDRAKFMKSEDGSPLGRTFTRGEKTEDEMAQVKPEYMAIPFVLFGDIIAAAMQNAEMREDIKLIFGTFTPRLVGITEGNADPWINHHEPIYDIPIALDYLVQFLFDNMVDKDRDEYPFRLFFDQFLRAITMLLNNQSEYKMRISFDYTLYMTQEEIKPEKDPDLLLLTKKDFPDIQKNLFNQIISSDKPVLSYYVLFARQVVTDFTGDRVKDEKAGIFHYALGADRGIAKNFNFSKQDTPQFQALQIEEINRPNRYPNALILPQNVSLDMVGNTLHKNGDLICVDSRAALGAMANEVLALGGYYRVVRSSNKITNQGYSTTVDAVFQHRMKNKKSGS
tara:strand:- start:4573 stop:7491 length:2919 start_codon:yes stop_codon:yes gene_type:complete